MKSLLKIALMSTLLSLGACSHFGHGCKSGQCKMHKDTKECHQGQAEKCDMKKSEESKEESKEAAK